MSISLFDKIDILDMEGNIGTISEVKLEEHQKDLFYCKECSLYEYFDMKINKENLVYNTLKDAEKEYDIVICDKESNNGKKVHKHYEKIDYGKYEEVQECTYGAEKAKDEDTEVVTKEEFEEELDNMLPYIQYKIEDELYSDYNEDELIWGLLFDCVYNDHDLTNEPDKWELTMTDWDMWTGETKQYTELCDITVNKVDKTYLKKKALIYGYQLDDIPDIPKTLSGDVKYYKEEDKYVFNTMSDAGIYKNAIKEYTITADGVELIVEYDDFETGEGIYAEYNVDLKLSNNDDAPFNFYIDSVSTIYNKYR